MGVAKLKRAELYYHRSVHEEVAAALQETGVCQIVGQREDTAASAEIEALRSESEERLADVRYLMRALGPHFKDPISSVDRMLGERPIVSMAELERLARGTDLAKVSADVRKIEHGLADIRMELSQARAGMALLEALASFPFPLSVITEGTRTLAGAMGTIKADRESAFKAALGDLSKFRQDTEVVVVPGDEKAQDLYVAVLYSRERGAEVLDACVKNGMSMVELPSSLTGTPKEEAERSASAIAALEARERALSSDMDDAAEKWMPSVQKLSDYWNSLAERWAALAGSGETETTLHTTFWLPAKEASRIQKKIEAIAPSVALTMSDPGEDEEPPTLLENGNCFRPFAILTDLYSPPTYRGIDPTPLLAPFFFIFFGMCLGDAGYALVMLGAIGWLFKKYHRVPSKVRDFIVLFAFCSISTFVYGIVSGSFFGDFIDAFLPILSPVKDALMLVDPMKDPTQVLGISLLFGVVHLMFGLSIAAYDEFRHGRPIDAVGADISWILLVVGLCFLGTAIGGILPPHFKILGQIMAIVGAVIVFWYAGREKSNIFSKITSGFLALYGSTSYLGDILSYSRLLALGFGSAVIGMIVNMLGGMAAGIPYVGWLIAVVVVVGGHIFSILINLLGSFVHPLRLQYVEFFGKFYSGGGETFAPLAHSEEFVEIASEGVAGA